MTENVIIIPTRLEAKRLPNKPIKKIKTLVRPLQAAWPGSGKGRRRRQRQSPDGAGEYRRQPADRAADAGAVGADRLRICRWPAG